MTNRLTAVIRREGGGCVALCPELDVASQGVSIEEACDNLREALAFTSNALRRGKYRIDLVATCSSLRSR